MNKLKVVLAIAMTLASGFGYDHESADGKINLDGVCRYMLQGL